LNKSLHHFLKPYPLNSLVAKDKETERQLLSFLNLKNQKWHLLYRASEDGFDASSFHKHCDNYCNTLTLIRTKNQSIFGGYTGAKWSSNAGFVTDPYAFVFSFKKSPGKSSFVARCIEPELAIYCQEMLGPAFGDNDISIADLSNENMLSRSVLLCYERDQQDKDEVEDEVCLLAESERFETCEIEVYCKDYEGLTNVKQKLPSIKRNKFMLNILENLITCLF
jgi:hypothetical protein